MFRNTTERRHPTEWQARELIDEVVRTAVRQQARDLEKRLGDIDKRLKTLENRR